MLIGAMACACILGAPAGFFAAGLLGREAGHGPSLSESATFGVVPVAVGAFMGLVVLAPGGMRTASRLGVAVVAASLVRMLLALAGGVVIYLVLKPEAAAYFGALLAAGLLCLMVEAAWGVRALRRVRGASGAVTA